MTLEFTLSRLQQRILAVVLALLPLGLLLAFAASCVSDIATHRHRVALLERERAEYAALASHAAQWSAELRRLQAVSTQAGLAFSDRTADAAAQTMQARVLSIVSASGGAGPQSRSEIYAAGDEGPTEIRTQVSFSADIEHLTHILFGLRQARPLLLPLTLSLRSASPAMPGADAPMAPHRLAVELVVTGYARTP